MEGRIWTPTSPGILESVESMEQIYGPVQFAPAPGNHENSFWDSTVSNPDHPFGPVFQCLWCDERGVPWKLLVHASTCPTRNASRE
jgi:hypothetical protein